MISSEGNFNFQVPPKTDKQNKRISLADQLIAQKDVMMVMSQERQKPTKKYNNLMTSEKPSLKQLLTMHNESSLVASELVPVSSFVENAY